MTLGIDWTIWVPSYIKVIFHFLEALATYSSIGCGSTRELCFVASWIKYFLDKVLLSMSSTETPAEKTQA